MLCACKRHAAKKSTKFQHGNDILKVSGIKQKHTAHIQNIAKFSSHRHSSLRFQSLITNKTQYDKQKKTDAQHQAALQKYLPSKKVPQLELRSDCAITTMKGVNSILLTHDLSKVGISLNKWHEMIMKCVPLPIHTSHGVLLSQEMLYMLKKK